METGRQTEALRDGLQLAGDGSGPLVQHDCWCVIRECRYPPAELVAYVRRHFVHIPPEQLAAFTRIDRDDAPLEVGDELRIRLARVRNVGVRVIDVADCSFTVATLQGHPIAGRLTFGAYRNARGDVIFHVRSRARSASRLDRLAHRLMGEPMQSTTWTDYLDRLAHMTGAGVIGSIHDESRTLPPSVERSDSPWSPTFVARD